jgi:polysaccharide biosynthesis protein PslH
VAFTASWTSHLPGRLTSMLALLAPSPRYFRLIYQPALFEQIRRVAEDRRVDVVIAYEMAAGDYVSRLDDGRFIKILDGCEPFAFRSSVDTIRSQARIWKLKHFLRQMLDHFDAYVAVSDAELRWIRREVAPRQAWGCTVPNGADVSDPFTGPVDRSRVIYTGSLSYRANLETVDYFLAEIWPSIREGQPDASFVVTGQPPDLETARRLQTVPGVSLAGLVSDYERFVSSSGVLAVPLLRGGGTRIKVLEAFALGCPVVATPKAVEGVAVSPGRDVLVANTPAEFARAVVSVMNDGRLRRSLIDNARLTAARYSWTRAQRTFVEAVDRCVEERAFLQPA